MSFSSIGLNSEKGGRDAVLMRAPVPPTLASRCAPPPRRGLIDAVQGRRQSRALVVDPAAAPPPAPPVPALVLHGGTVAVSPPCSAKPPLSASSYHHSSAHRRSSSLSSVLPSPQCSATTQASAILERLLNEDTPSAPTPPLPLVLKRRASLGRSASGAGRPSYTSLTSMTAQATSSVGSALSLHRGDVAVSPSLSAVQECSSFGSLAPSFVRTAVPAPLSLHALDADSPFPSPRRTIETTTGSPTPSMCSSEFLPSAAATPIAGYTPGSNSQSCLRARPRNLTEFPASELLAHSLSQALYTLAPPEQPRSRAYLAQLRRAVTEAVAEAKARTRGGGCLDERHALACAEQARRVVALSRAPGPASVAYPTLSAVCDAAGKPGNEDRLFVVHDAVAYLCPDKGGEEEEPCTLLGVLDGHGGSDTAQYCKMMLPHHIVESEHFPGDIPEALRCGFRTMQQRLVARYGRTHSSSGTTATVAVLYRQRIYVANVGDSHAVVVTEGECGSTTTTLTARHHITDEEEQQAVRARGGDVYAVRGVLRVEGVCQVSRNLGLVEVEALGHEPHVVTHDVADGDRMLVVASDGLWDVVDTDDVGMAAAAAATPECAPLDSSVGRCSWAGDLLSPTSTVVSFNDTTSFSVQGDEVATTTAKGLLRSALSQGTRDNCTVIVVVLSEPNRLEDSDTSLLRRSVTRHTSSRASSCALPLLTIAGSPLLAL